MNEIAHRYGVLLTWILIVIVFSILKPALYFSLDNFRTIFESQAILLIVTLGMIISLAAGEFDLSIAGVLGLTLVLVGQLNVNDHWSIWPAIVVGMLVGLVVGAINAFLVVIVGVESIIVTLGMGTLLAGIATAINPQTTSGISAGLVGAVRHEVFGLQLVFYYALALTVIVWFMFTYTPFGRHLYFVGAGRDVARLSGVRVDRIRALSLLCTSLVSAGAGVILAGDLGASDPNVAASLLLPAFAGAFLGAASIKPGRFNAWGSFIAVYFLVSGITGLEALGLSGWIEQVFYGASLVIAVAMSRLLGRRRQPI